VGQVEDRPPVSLAGLEMVPVSDSTEGGACACAIRAGHCRRGRPLWGPGRVGRRPVYRLRIGNGMGLARALSVANIQFEFRFTAE
jgi:hypothetical protein